MLNPPTITIEAAGLAYQGREVFDQLYGVLSGAKITCLLGASGSGKTSLLRLIAGLTKGHTTTRIQASDQVPLTNRIAYMAQTDLLLPWLTVTDNILIGMRLRGQVPQATDYQHVTHLLTQLNLAEAAQQKPASLSGGMRQRVALARTLFEDKPIILMDEPFAALDAITRFELQTLTARCLQHKTVLLVTHDPFEALRMGHRIYILSGQPAHLQTPIVLPGVPPRDPHDPELLLRYAELLNRLSQGRV